MLGFDRGVLLLHARLFAINSLAFREPSGNLRLVSAIPRCGRPRLSAPCDAGAMATFVLFRISMLDNQLELGSFSMICAMAPRHSNLLIPIAFARKRKLSRRNGTKMVSCVVWTWPCQDCRPNPMRDIKLNKLAGAVIRRRPYLVDLIEFGAWAE